MPWWEEFFDEHYFDLYDLYLTPERTAKEVEGVIQILALPPGAKSVSEKWSQAGDSEPGSGVNE